MLSQQDSQSRPGADSSAPLPQFSIFDEDEPRRLPLVVAKAAAAKAVVARPVVDEEEEFTVRRFFPPKRPARVAVDVSDADATWKWTAPKADAQGTFAGLALPTLEDDEALEFDHSEVEATQERATPFALMERGLPLVTPRRRVAPARKARSGASPKWLVGVAVALALGAGISVVAAGALPTVHHATQQLQRANANP